MSLYEKKLYLETHLQHVGAGSEGGGQLILPVRYLEEWLYYIQASHSCLVHVYINDGGERRLRTPAAPGPGLR